MLRGQRLDEVLHRVGRAYLGQPLDALPGGAFPLLVKFLDARENLSIQVHPDDTYARAREGWPFGKSEMWYVLGAEPGARVFHGLARDVSAEELGRVFSDGAPVDVLAQVEVHPGDVLINPPGTVHALGGGIVLYELQQSCDLTYRLYDWDRSAGNGPPRELHLDKGLEVIDARALTRHKVEPVVLAEPNYERAILCVSRYFVAERLTYSSRLRIEPPRPRFELLTVLVGRCRVRSGADEAWHPLRPGESVLLPAVHGAYEVEAAEGPSSVIRAYVPDLLADLVEPLRARGIPVEQIAQLGGDVTRSDLVPYLR
jgi:mannose-6-phosphate isomerase